MHRHRDHREYTDQLSEPGVGGRDARLHEGACREQNGEKVINEGPGEVEVDPAHGCPR